MRKSPMEKTKRNKKDIVQTQPIIEQIPKELEKIEDNISPSIVDQTPEEERGIQLQRIVKKRQYKACMKLIRDGKYTSARVVARLLGVDDKTVNSWLKTKKAIEIMNNTVDIYVSKIEQSKDWKAQAYLLDRLQGNKDTEMQGQTLQQMIVINT